jgi:hypothetical protein
MSWLARFMRVNSRVSPTRRKLCVMPYRIPPLGTPSLSAIQRKAMHVPMAPRVISNGIAGAKLTSALHLTTFWIAEPMRGAPIPIVSLDISLIGSTELVRTCLQIPSGQPHPARGLGPFDGEMLQSLPARGLGPLPYPMPPKRPMVVPEITRFTSHRVTELEWSGPYAGRR